MPALLGPTNPVPSYEAPPVKVTTPPANDQSVNNIVNPQQVVRPDRRTDQQDTGDATQSFAARYESNFMTFLQRLRGMPDLNDTLLRLFQGQSMYVTSGIRSGFSQEISKFLDFLQMDEGKLLSFLKNQAQGGARFSGALFDALRTAYANTHSEILKNDILQFLRKYSDFTSTPHLEGKVLRTVSDMTGALPSRWGDKLTQILAQLENGVAAGDRAGNLKLLRGQVFPLISQYVSLTHDHGRARGLLSMLALDVARYENGDPKGLVQAFRHLAANSALPERLQDLSTDEVLRLLQETSFAKASRNDAFSDRLSETIHSALQGKNGVEAQEAFRNILSSLILNESVYMPLNHIMLPLVWDGRLLFSEMWMDPDAEKTEKEREEERRRGGGDGGEGKTLRILLKMDIQDRGAFDLLLNERGGEVSLHVACPAVYAPFTEQMAQALGQILERRGLRANGVTVAEMKRPIAVSEAFPKIFERVSGVNVKI